MGLEGNVGCSKLGVHFLGVLLVRALLLGVCITKYVYVFGHLPDMTAKYMYIYIHTYVYQGP